jgi:hypothetical protein
MKSGSDLARAPREQLEHDPSSPSRQIPTRTRSNSSGALERLAAAPRELGLYVGALAAAYGPTARISEQRVDVAEVLDIAAEAASVRNGWKVVLARCAPVKRQRPAVQTTT